MNQDIVAGKRRSRYSSSTADGIPKKKKGFMDVYTRRYDPSVEGYGNPQEWRSAFGKRMNLDDALKAVGTKSPFEILGLSDSETNWDTIKKAYRSMAMQYHPDVCKDVDAEAKMKEVNGAYTILEKRFGK